MNTTIKKNRIKKSYNTKSNINENKLKIIEEIHHRIVELKSNIANNNEASSNNCINTIEQKLNELEKLMN